MSLRILLRRAMLTPLVVDVYLIPNRYLEPRQYYGRIRSWLFPSSRLVPGLLGRLLGYWVSGWFVSPHSLYPPSGAIGS